MDTDVVQPSALSISQNYKNDIGDFESGTHGGVGVWGD